MNDLHRALNSLFDVLHLHSDGVDEVIDEAVEALNLMSHATEYPVEALSMVKKRAEAIREAVKNNPLPELSPPCKPPAH
jgi:hypothetical protein